MLNLIWLKRDFRLNDHAPFWDASLNNAPVIPFYVFENEYWRLPDSSFRHWSFVHDALAELDIDLQKYDNSLYFYHGTVIDFLDKYKDIGFTLWSHEETGNQWTYQRDIEVQKWCELNSIKWHESPTNGIVRRLSSRDECSKIRNQIMASDLISPPKYLPRYNDNKDFPLIKHKEFSDIDYSCYSLQKGGREIALRMLKSFLEFRVINYSKNISKPYDSWNSCARLSPYITFGNISIREICYFANQKIQSLSKDTDSYHIRNIRSFLSRIAWHCHFIQKLEQQPSIEFECMHSSFEGVRTTSNLAYLDAWVSGNTGYPLIDACMRALTIHGWINFRMRAMVTSFASYNLWLDWRDFGPKLAQLFIDYEPGIHFSQLQMQSGVTGINSIRVYNPLKQSIESDANGNFIRKYVPELNNLPLKYLHNPLLLNEDEQELYGVKLGINYPQPIVDHEETARFAKKIIFDCKKTDGFRDSANQVFEKLGSRKTSTRKTKLSAVKTDQQESLF